MDSWSDRDTLPADEPAVHLGTGSSRKVWYFPQAPVYHALLEHTTTSLCRKQLRGVVKLQMCAELVFQLFDRVGPLERLSCLIVVSDEVQNRLLQLVETSKRVGCRSLR